MNPAEGFARTREVIADGLRERLHIGAQVYVSLAGEPCIDLALGEAREGIPLTPDSLMLWMSSVKPVTAIALLQLEERGLVALDDRVCRHIPEFAAGGKEGVTLRHVLTHTGGFPSVALQWSASPWRDILAEICAAPLEPGWVPGERAAYHVASGWFVLAEVVRRRDGRDFAGYVREEIFAPLGLSDSWIGMPPQAHRAYGDRIAPMHATEIVAIPHPYWPWAGSADACALCRPGGSAWGPAHDLGRLYEALLRGGERDGRRVLRSETVSQMTARHTRGLFDETFKTPFDRGLGVVVDSKSFGAAAAWFGPHCSPRTFGHAGYRCSVGFGDPEHDLAVAVIFNGMPDDARHEARMHRTLAAIYADLGLA